MKIIFCRFLLATVLLGWYSSVAAEEPGEGKHTVLFRNDKKTVFSRGALLGIDSYAHGSPVSTGINDERIESGPARFALTNPLRTAMLLLRERRTPSPAKAFLFSFLLPGMGEYYAGSPKMMRVFLATEALLWATFASFRVYGDWKRNDYRQFAASHAGVDLAGKDYEYFVDVENFNSIQEYNAFKLQERLLNELYPETAEYAWEWDSEDSRKEFERLRLASDSAYHSSTFIVACVLLNHLVSGIDAIRVARKVRKASEIPVQVGVTALPEGGGLVMLWKRF